MPKSIELRVDVREAVSSRTSQYIAATVRLPDVERLHAPPIALFAAPGGGYNRNYFDLQIPGHPDYSQAEYHTEQGFVFVAYDHIGVGDSGFLDPASITLESLVRANHLAVSSIIRRLELGTVDPSFPSLGRFRTVGLGQSMGGCVTVLMQSLHHSFQAIAVLGFSAIHTVLPEPTAEAQRASASAFSGYLRAGDDAGTQRVQGRDIRNVTYAFYWEDVPHDIVKADTAGGHPIRVHAPPWGTRILPCAFQMMERGVIAKEAAVIDVPVLVAAGSRDVLPTPLQEPAAYAQSSDVSVFIVDRMAHMHNFASTRVELWNRISSWAKVVSTSRPSMESFG